MAASGEARSSLGQGPGAAGADRRDKAQVGGKARQTWAGVPSSPADPSHVPFPALLHPELPQFAHGNQQGHCHQHQPPTPTGELKLSDL